ncbi:haloacid dehalogenase [Clostridium thermosuccinogenes]|uniref:Haloacid dehalogenase n=1 Tax=Clostridium thermosuccinogenes TaxID=84032 RepID=A0A2K2FBE7_9CLOT|nr:cation-transporting P-type ATPase [Pseudoclostridium thermosuccinogenes]AUS97016.1 haloacid dehalogenase [Pseudoclostridium thermosuccinogenes]PNT96110.1 haloacid dehalogenase [Pseudoclostridium thermosuccinogenes]PNT97721.1 haloacid dehalogenase [Pseudoclostridium thermosuccinogenes]
MEKKNEALKEKSTENICKLTVEDACKLLDTNANGLTSEEAKRRQQKYGRNIISEKKDKSPILVFLSNFTGLMAILLWTGGIIAFVADMPQLGIAIWMVNIINGIFSYWQEHRAGKATEALKKMLPSYTRVIRDGQEQQILAEDLVPGDIMLIEEGDKISADARLIASSDLQVNQSTLTGESNPVRKAYDPVLREGLSRFEIPNLIFAGTSVSSGTGKAVIISTGMSTEFGKIADLTQTLKEEKSPLEKELDKLTKQISIIAISAGVIFFAAAVFFVRQPLAQAFIFSLGMVVAFIPEGLLPTVTLSLAMAVQRMAKEHALVKKLSAVETLGCTSVICSDKTGTLTQNEMTVSNLWLLDQEFEVTGLGYAPEGKIIAGQQEVSAANNGDLKLLLTAAALCSNARVIPPKEESERYTVLGDPTEACLGVVAKKAGIDVDEQSTLTPRLRELPFDSRRKRMSTIHQLEKPVEGCRRIAYIKGSPKEVLELCTGIHRQNRREELTDEQRARIMEANDKYARNGLRVLAVAYRLMSQKDNLPAALSAYTPELVERDMTFIGLVVMADPPRPEVAAAVEKCHKANIRIIMITGDYGLTAESIAKRIGIVKGEHPRIISGTELGNMSDEELKEALKDEVIFARVAPEQKYRVVSNLQEMGHVVAVTGDGVNDSPALKKADIGVAMGISGTDVAKEAADMILTDDNFASIVRAIEEGRAVYNNIRKFILYILNSNTPEALPSAAFLFSRGGIPLPLTVMQILLIDLGTDMLPALGLGTELPEKGIMDRPPRTQRETLLNRHIVIKGFFWYGLIESVIALGAYFFVNMLNGWPNVPLASSGVIYRQATTMTLAAIVFCQIGMVLNCRTERQSVFKVGLFGNRTIMRGIIFELLLISLIIYVPFLQEIFQTAPIGINEWLFLIVLPPLIVFVEEVRKAISRRYFKIIRK